jgi:signal-transduction protein with cAMP-binding, CBS, and nucleotidyltransferase domain
MHAHGVRHMPVVADGKPVGIVTARDALDPELEEFVAEARRRESIR